MFAYVTREKSDASLEIQIKTFWLIITSSIYLFIFWKSNTSLDYSFTVRPIESLGKEKGEFQFYAARECVCVCVCVFVLGLCC